jgi:hypothetical protein
MTTPFCTFCMINGYDGPYDHYVRASRDSNAKVTCPMLLSTVCGYCRKNGHTAKFCVEAKMRTEKAKTEITVAKNAAFINGDWITKSKKQYVKYPNDGASANNKSVFHEYGGYTMLCKESNEDLLCKESNEDLLCKESRVDDLLCKESGVVSWADIAKGKNRATILQSPQILQSRPTGMSWADWDEI